MKGKCYLLNVIDITQYQSPNHQILQKLWGPDIIDNIHGNKWDYIKRHHPSIIDHPRHVSYSQKDISTEGATLVIFKGTLTSLSQNNDIKKKLLPHPEDILLHNRAPTFNLRYMLSQVANPIGNSYPLNCNDFQNSTRTCQLINTTCYDIAEHPNGLLFAFQECNNENNNTTTKTIVLQKHMSHQDIYEQYQCIVISHWFHIDSIIKVNQDTIAFFTDAFGDVGHGNRLTTPCDGTNVYTGEKHTKRTCPDPFTSYDTLFYSQRYNQSYSSFVIL